MKGTETLMKIMDEIQRVVEFINQYVDKANDLISKLKEWINKIITFISDGIEKLSKWSGVQRKDHLQFADDYLFV